MHIVLSFIRMIKQWLIGQAFFLFFFYLFILLSNTKIIKENTRSHNHLPSLLATQLRGREEMEMAPGQLLKEPKQLGNGLFIEDLTTDWYPQRI